MISAQDRHRAVELIDEAVSQGARFRPACEQLGISLRTLQRWRQGGQLSADGRSTASRPVPANKLSEAERALVLSTANEARFAALPPTQIVPQLADEGRYVASESSFYRILREERQLAHRGRARARVQREVPRQCARGPNQLWCWDITYLPRTVRGTFFFLYLILDVYSRKIVAHEVHTQELGEYAAALIERAALREAVPAHTLVVHQDNGSVMKASSFTSKLQQLGIERSYNRPGVSDDNAYAESLFRTCKYRPDYPGSFETLEQAREWVLSFVRWYNEVHKHRNLKFISPAQRHCGADRGIFAARRQLYEQARAGHPQRWSRTTRNWSLLDEVWLNRPIATASDREVI